MTRRTAYVVAAAPGLAPGGTPTGRDVLDLLDVELWAHHGPPDAYDWAGPMFVALFALVGAWPQEAAGALATDFPEGGADAITLHNGYGDRQAAVIELARNVLVQGAKEMRKVRKCDCLVVNRNGGPFTPQMIESLFARLSSRIGIGGFGLPLRLRLAFRSWVEDCEQPRAIAELCRSRAKISAARRRDEASPTIAFLRGILEKFHPLGKLTRPILQHVRAPDRAHPDRAFARLSVEALADVEAVRAGSRGAFCYPGELVRAVLDAWDGGRRAGEIAAHYGIPDQNVSLWIRRRAKGKDPTRPTRPLRVRSNREALLKHIRRHPDQTVFEVRDWMEKRRGARIEAGVLRSFGVAHGHRLASARATAIGKRDRKTLARFLREHPHAKLRDAREFAKERLGLKLKNVSLYHLARTLGFRFAPGRRGPATEPARSLLLAYIPDNPDATADIVVGWLAREHGIALKSSSLRGFALKHGLVLASKRHNERKRRRRKGGLRIGAARLSAGGTIGPRRKRVGPEQEPYRSAILAHAAANPQKTARQVRRWIEQELELKTSKPGFRHFAKRHGLKFAPAFTFAAEADASLLAFLHDNPQATMPETRVWISNHLRRPVSTDLLTSFACRHRHQFPPARFVIDVEPVRDRLIEHIRVNPSETIAAAKAWIERELRIEVSEDALYAFANKYGLAFKPKRALTKPANRRALEGFLSTHPNATVRDAQVWCRSTFRQEVNPQALYVFAKKRGHRFAPSWIGPDTEPYRTELMKWMHRHPGATAPRASQWLFDRFAVDVAPERLHGFARRNGLKFACGYDAQLPRGTAKKLRRDAALVGLHNPSMKRQTWRRAPVF